MNSKALIFTIITATFLVSGCSNKMELESKVGTLTNQVNELSTKVDNLESAHINMQADTAAAASEAQRANMRIDNIAESYKK